MTNRRCRVFVDDRSVPVVDSAGHDRFVVAYEQTKATAANVIAAIGKTGITAELHIEAVEDVVDALMKELATQSEK